MSKTLLIFDLHHRHKIADAIMASVPHDSVIFLGDYQDDFSDLPMDARATAMWLKSQIKNNKKAIFCGGNHDYSYRFNTSDCALCSGFTTKKSIEIDKILTVEDWQHLKPYHYHKEGNFLISHAGFSEKVFSSHLLNNFDALDNAFNMALCSLTEKNSHHAFFAAGRERGGQEPEGGVTWLDFTRIKPLAQYNQIVGHTPVSAPMVKYNHPAYGLVTEKWDNDKEYVSNFVANGDTHQYHYALITDGKLSFHPVLPEWRKSFDAKRQKQKEKDLLELFNSVNANLAQHNR